MDKLVLKVMVWFMQTTVTKTSAEYEDVSQDDTAAPQ